MLYVLYLILCLLKVNDLHGYHLFRSVVEAEEREKEREGEIEGGREGREEKGRIGRDMRIVTVDTVHKYMYIYST